MNTRIIAPLVMLATITTLTSCVTRDIVPAPVVVPATITTETPVPAPKMPTVTPAPSVEILSGATTETTSAAETTTKVMTYQSPGGLDEVEFTVTVDKGVITAVSAKVMATNDASKYNQGNFAKEVSAKVVGKAKKNFTLDTVGGASLTTTAFEKFVQTL